MTTMTTTYACSDCGNTVEMVGQTLRRGSTVREPGEPLCLGCSATRSRMVKALEKLPDTLDAIKAMRMVR